MRREDWIGIWNKNENVLDIFGKNMDILNPKIIIEEFKFKSINFFNERTLAYELSWNLKNEVESMFPESKPILINEFNIKLNREITEELKINNIKLAKNKKKKKINFIPDAFLKLNNEFVFIEYKVDNKFNFNKFAHDLLKFKHYTYELNQLNTTFIYVIIKKNDDKFKKPTLKYEGNIGFNFLEFLDKNNQKIDENSIDKNATVFIVENKNKDSKINISPLTLVLMEDINDNTKKMEREEIGWDDIKDNYKDEFENNKSFFGNKVLTANIILENYSSIKNVFYELIEEGENIKVSEDIYKIDINCIKEMTEWLNNANLKTLLEEDKEKLIRVLTKTTTYYNDFIKDVSPKDRVKNVEIDRNDHSLQVVRSNWIIAIIDFFCEINNFKFEHKKKKAFKEMKIKINDYYNKNTSNMEKFNELSMGLIFFIENFYKKRAKEDEKEPGKYIFNKDYLIFKTKNDVIDDLKQLNKILNFSNTTFEDENFDFDEEFINLIKKILIY